MYLEHFGLDSPPFKITPTTDFFFSGANRGEILDALIYAITEGEGIVKVTGEVGSGKTMLCRMLLERLPQHVESIYLANPSLSREEMLYAIADGLGLSLEGQRVNVIMQSLQNRLVQKFGEGKRLVVLVDEAHAMPLDTLEELRLLYNLQSGNHKLLHLVLFGQPELNMKLDQPSMRQLKDRIVHHFIMAPLSRPVVEAYLMFRMRTAGYRGPNLFTPAAVSLIGAASQGLMRRTNILADKALLAAFVEGAYSVGEHHVQAAIRDSEMPMPHQLGSWRKLSVMAASLLAAVVLLASLGWLFGGGNRQMEIKANIEPQATAEHTPFEASSAPSASPAAPVTVPAVAAADAVSDSSIAQASQGHQVIQQTTASRTQPGSDAEAESGYSLSLLQQRLAATQEMLAGAGAGGTSIQLYYTTISGGQQERLERFLARTKGLGMFSDIYILPMDINGKPGYRVLYGFYQSIEEGEAGMEQLPQRFKKAFNPMLYPIDTSRL